MGFCHPTCLWRLAFCLDEDSSGEEENMKKTALVFIALLLAVGFISCAKPPNPKEQLALPLKITAKMLGSDSIFQAEITETECRVTFSGSDALSDTVLVLSPDGNTATAGGFSRSVPNGIFPPQEMLFNALKLLNSEQASGTSTENGMKYAIDETEIMVYYDKKTGVLTGIETEESGRRFKFTVLSLEPYEAQSNGAG